MPKLANFPVVRALGAAFALGQALDARTVSALRLRIAVKELALECEPLLEDKECLAALAFLCAQVSILLERSRIDDAAKAPVRRSLERLSARLRVLQDAAA